MLKIPGMKKGKEIKPNIFKNYKIAFGSINNKQPKAIFINISSWLEPKDELQQDYSRIIKDIKKKVKQSLYDYFYYTNEQDVVFERNIVDLDIRDSGVRFGKRSFMNCEITLFLREEHPINSDHMVDKLTKISKEITDICFKDNPNFNFHKRKI